MVVVGCTGRGAVGRVLLVRSVRVFCAERAARSRSSTTKTHRRPPPRPPCLVGIDGSPASELATAIAFDEASLRGVELRALHAWSDIGCSNSLSRIGAVSWKRSAVWLNVWRAGESATRMSPCTGSLFVTARADC